MTNTVSQIVSDETLDSIIQIESGGDPKNKAPTSSALGLGQFLNATWLGTVKKHRPDVFKNRSNAQVLAMRTDARFSIEMLARFTEDNMDVVGRNCSPGDLYLAHFLGAGMAQRFFRAQRTTNAVTLAGEGAANANRTIFYDRDGAPKTTGQVREWAAAKMAKAGGKGWVRKFYKSGAVALLDEPAEDPEFTGDPDLRDIQADLKSMNYNPGDLDGLWGGGTSGALSGFINDRGGFIPAPTSLDQFHDNFEVLKQNIDDAMSEGFKRPVSEIRARGKVEDVAKVAPAILPVAQNEKWSFRGAIAAAGTGGVTLASNAWSWFVGNKDSLPTDPGTIKTGLGYLQAIPPGVWILLAAVVLGLIWRNSRNGRQQIAEAVQTGAQM